MKPWPEGMKQRLADLESDVSFLRREVQKLWGEIEAQKSPVTVDSSAVMSEKAPEPMTAEETAPLDGKSFAELLSPHLKAAFAGELNSATRKEEKEEGSHPVPDIIEEV